MFRHNIVKGIFPGFVPCTHQNTLWYNCETGHIGPVNHIRFDESMNDLPFKLLSSNQRNTQPDKQVDKFPAVPVGYCTLLGKMMYAYITC